MKKLKKLLITLLLLVIQKPALAWSPESEVEFQQRSKEYLEKFPAGIYGSTAYEYEKQSYPKAMIDFLRGNREQGITFLASEDKQSDLHSHTLGIDFYSGFTLKGQIRKYFGFGQFLSPGYKLRMREAMRLFTRVDPLTQHFEPTFRTLNCHTSRKERPSSTWELK